MEAPRAGAEGGHLPSGGSSWSLAITQEDLCPFAFNQENSVSKKKICCPPDSFLLYHYYWRKVGLKQRKDGVRGWEPPQKEVWGRGMLLPTVRSGSSQEGDKGRDAGDPGGQERHSRFIRGQVVSGVMEGRGIWGVRETRRQEGGKGG